MNRCPYCRKFTWPWQSRFFSLHRTCLEIYCQGYAQGIRIASEQAAKIILEVQKRTAPTEKHETLQ